ncbi:MAG TPA: NHL repeat-containing protein [candidate division Zixibacteria bacterium]|nr:NHL repeat-containing protein [candidate division Zixibacteria bacterium]
MNKKTNRKATHLNRWRICAALVGFFAGLSLLLTACSSPLEFRRGDCLPYASAPIALSTPRMMVRAWAPQGDRMAIYVSDYANDRVAAVSVDGDTLIRHFGEGCSGACSLNGPTGVAVGPFVEFFGRPVTDPPATFRLYVSDSKNDRVVEFDENGEVRRTWGGSGQGNGQFNRPYGIAVDLAGRVFVADSGNNRVQVFDTTGQYLMAWGSEGSDSGQFRGPHDIVIGVNGDLSTSFVAVSDNGNGRVQLFTPDGALLKIIGGLGDVRGMCTLSDTSTLQIEAVAQYQKVLYYLDAERGVIRRKLDLKGSFHPVDVLPTSLIADQNPGSVCSYGYFEK